MSEPIHISTSTHIDSVDAYAKYWARIAVLSSWLHDQIALGDPHSHDPLIVDAIAFLHEQVFECRRAQDELFHEATGGNQ